MSKHSITSIDIGSFTTNVVTLVREDKTPRVAARASVPTKGVEHGHIISPEDTFHSVKRAVSMVEQKLGEKIHQVVISASGTGLESGFKSTSTIVTLGSGEVGTLDIEKSIEKAEAKAISPNRKIIESVATSYVLDGKSVIGSPVGMKGKKLETTVFFIDFPSTIIEHFENICDKLDVELVDVIPSPLACSCVSLSDIERKVGSVLVDIGSDTTEVLVYEHDRPLLLKSLPYGSNDITNALALGLKITVEEAESVKLGILPKDAFHEGKSEVIIKKSLTKLFKDINKELAAISRKQLLPAGIILSGGGALTSGIDELAKEILCIPARRGAPKSVGKLSKHDNGEYDIPWSVAYGLAILGLERRRSGMYGSFGNVGEKMKGFLRKFFI